MFSRSSFDKLRADNDKLILKMEENSALESRLLCVKPLTKEQLDAQVDWLNTWDQLRDTAIPMRFYEQFSKNLHLNESDKPRSNFWMRLWIRYKQGLQAHERF